MTEHTIHNIADWQVTLDGRDLTDTMRPYLVALSLSEQRGEEADQLDITLDDSAGDLAIPPEGAMLSLALGWKQGQGVTPGLIHKGSFKVDDVSHSGPPDQIKIKARAADFTSDLRNRREHSWRDTTLGTILQDIATRNGLVSRIASDLANIELTFIAQSRESDIAFIRRLGREYDAVATIKAGHLLFTRKGASATASGEPLPILTIHRQDGDRHNWQRQKREGQAGVTAFWHDRKSAKRKSVTVGSKKGAKRLRRTYADAQSARQAASAEQTRLKRAPATLDMKLALGRANAAPENRITVIGYKPDIDATQWLITEVNHRLDKSGGFTTDIKMETAP